MTYDICTSRADNDLKFRGQEMKGNVFEMRVEFVARCSLSVLLGGEV